MQRQCATQIFKKPVTSVPDLGPGTCLSMRSKPSIGPAAPSTSGRTASSKEQTPSLPVRNRVRRLGVGCTPTRGWKVPRGGGGAGGEREGEGVCCTFRPFRPFSDHFKSKNLL